MSEKRMLGPGLEISPIVTGLWQVADMERDGNLLDPDAASDAMADYARAGFDTFDMADHYGSAELIAGRFRARRVDGAIELGEDADPRMLTKWCPHPGVMSPEAVRAGVEERLERLGTSKIDLLQLHWWMYEHPGYVDAMKELVKLQHEGLIAHLGVTNFNTDHLRVLVKHGLWVVSNQVCLSLLDRRASGRMTDFCLDNSIKLLAYGTLGGGFLTDRWVGAPKPAPEEIGDWSKMKYARFVNQIGGWGVLQTLLAALKEIADRYEVSVANVATRWVLEQQAVGAVIVGARLGEREHREDNRRVLSFTLDNK
ncbi:MAG: aldo/keto reductase, partial [Hyphomicrobiales bacterium]